MERRIAKKITCHYSQFRDDIENWLLQNNIDLINKETGENCLNQLKIYMENYRDIEFTKEDFLKRKRIKNMAPQNERCIAKRADGTQCTRRKKNGECYCGTHIKGTPHGEISADGDAGSAIKEVKVWTQEINGINCFIDESGNVYKVEDVMQGRQNPTVVGKWEKIDGVYSMKETGMV